MLDAARGLLSENGPGSVTHLRVSETSGVARATVYRHWPDRADILLDLLRGGADLHLTPPPENIPLADRVTVLLRKLATSLNGDNGRILTAMIGLAEWDEDVFAALERMRAFGPTLLRDILAAGLDDGSLVAGTNIDLIMDVLIGPLFLQRLLHHAEITEGYVDNLVATALEPRLTE
jgi:AcrR family transcriptional regulator